MDRVTRRIIGYIVTLGFLVLAMFAALPWPPGWPHLLAVAALLLPGRVQGVLWRDFFRGRHAMDRHDFVDAQSHFLSFLQKLRQRPQLRYAAFLAWNFYTWSAQAMTCNNLGACHLVQGQLDAAEAMLIRSRELDPGCPLPYFNLAVLAYARGAQAEGERLRALAARLGYRAGTRERMISSAGSTLAAVEGRL